MTNVILVDEFINPDTIRGVGNDYTVMGLRDVFGTSSIDQNDPQSLATEEPSTIVVEIDDCELLEEFGDKLLKRFLALGNCTIIAVNSDTLKRFPLLDKFIEKIQAEVANPVEVIIDPPSAPQETLEYDESYGLPPIEV